MNWKGIAGTATSSAVRPMLQSLPEDDWILRPRVMESLSLIAQTGLAFDFLTFTRHLPYVLKVLERVPEPARGDGSFVEA